MTDFDERQEELETIASIYPELIVDAANPYAASLDLAVKTTSPLAVVVGSSLPTPPASDDEQAKGLAPIHLSYDVSHLPPLQLSITLPEGYPSEKPPQFKLSTSPAYLPEAEIAGLEEKGRELWEEYGRTQIIYSYISYLVDEAAPDGFGLGGTLHVSEDVKNAVVDFDTQAKRTEFEQHTYDCGVCLDPKKGKECFQLSCGDIFCRQCLLDFYNNSITEGNVMEVKCLNPNCPAEASDGKRKRKSARPLKPSELLQIPLEMDMVKRYVELKRKKKIESDKSTIYCPRQWCQGFAKSAKYPQITTNLDQIAFYDNIEDNVPEKAEDVNTEKPEKLKKERLAVCEKCNLAFCSTCFKSWHGEFVNCRPRNPAELTEEEQASYDFIAKNTSPCPYCEAPTQKTYGCNHMTCLVCKTHFCYLCQAYLVADNPYAHFNNPKLACFQRLFEGEMGEEVHFEGARGWELAIAAVEEADAREVAARPQAQPEEPQGAAVAHPNPAPALGAPVPAAQHNLVLDIAHMDLEGQQQNHPAGQQGILVEIRNGAIVPIRRRPPPAQLGRPRQLRRPALSDGGVRVHQGRGRDLGVNHAEHGGGGRAALLEVNQAGLRRFVNAAMDDEEEDWDSDELDDPENDGDWEIRER